MDTNYSNRPTVVVSNGPAPLPARVRGVAAADLLRQALVDPVPDHRAPWGAPRLEDVAAWLPQYRIECLLGRGGMGAVYKGEQLALERSVAIKLLPVELAADAQFLARFQREAKVLARLQHPGIVTVHDFGQTGAGHLYFIMDFVDGTDLHRLMRGGRVQPAQALDLLTQVCDALQYAHAQGVVHRDIKPANILIARDGRAKLADFGLALPTNESPITCTNLVLGTPAYMAPEQSSGTADRRSDIYALGVTLYEMLTGERPSGAFDPPSQHAQTDVRLDHVVTKALQQRPERRYQEVAEFKKDIDLIRATPVARSDSPTRASHRRTLLLWIVALALFAAIGVWRWLAPHAPEAAAFPPNRDAALHVTPAPSIPPPPGLSPQPAASGERRAIKAGEMEATEIKTNSAAKDF